MLQVLSTSHAAPSSLKALGRQATAKLPQQISLRLPSLQGHQSFHRHSSTGRTFHTTPQPSARLWQEENRSSFSTGLFLAAAVGGAFLCNKKTAEAAASSETDDSQMVTLKDGYQVNQELLIIVTMQIETLKKENYVAFYDLVQKCKNPDYEFVRTPFGDSRAILEKNNLIDGNGKIRDDIREIVLSSVEGAGRSLRLVNPLKNDNG